MLEKINKLLGEELASQVAEKLGEVELGIVNDGTLVPSQKHDGMKNEFKATKEQLETLQSQMQELEKSSGTIEELKKNLATKNEEYEKFKAEAEKRETSFIKKQKLKEGLSEKFAKDSIDLLVNTFDLDNLAINESGAIVDLDSKINKLAEERPSLAIQKNITSVNPSLGKSVTEENLESDQDFFNAMMKK